MPMVTAEITSSLDRSMFMQGIPCSRHGEAAVDRQPPLCHLDLPVAAGSAKRGRRRGARGTPMQPDQRGAEALPTSAEPRAGVGEGDAPAHVAHAEGDAAE